MGSVCRGKSRPFCLQGEDLLPSFFSAIDHDATISIGGLWTRGHQPTEVQSADFWLVSDTQCFYSVLRKPQSVTETGGVNLAVYLGDWLLLVQSTQEVTTQMSDFKMQSELHNKHRKVCTTCTFSGFMPELNHLYSLSVMRVKVFRAWTVPSVTEAGDANQRKDKSKFSHFLLLILFTSMGEFSACYSQCVRGTKLTVFFQKLFL